MHMMSTELKKVQKLCSKRRWGKYSRAKVWPPAPHAAEAIGLWSEDADGENITFSQSIGTTCHTRDTYLLAI